MGKILQSSNSVFKYALSAIVAGGGFIFAYAFHTEALSLTKTYTSVSQAKVKIDDSGVSSYVEKIFRSPSLKEVKAVGTRSENGSDRSTSLIMEEDFSLFSAGTMDDPDSEELTMNGNYYIPSEYTHLPYWWGVGVYQGGGVCVLNNNPGRSRALVTPNFDLGGKIVYEADVKVKSGDAGIILVLCSGTPSSPKPLQVAQMNIDASEDWVHIRKEWDNPIGTPDCFVQINAFADDYFYVDNVKISRDEEYVPVPVSAVCGNFTDEGFDVAWWPMPHVDGYLLNLYKAEPCTPESVTVSQNFDDEVGLPAGWNGSFAGSAITAGGSEGSPALCFSTTGDEVSWFAPEGYITDVEFDVVIGSDMSQSWAKVLLSGYSDGVWTTIDEKYLSQLSQGENRLKFNDLATYGITGFKIQSDWFYQNEIFLVDNVDVCYAYDEVKVAVKTDIPTETAYYTFTGLDMTTDYYFNVRSVKGSIVSEPCPLVYALGVAAPFITGYGREGDNLTVTWTPVFNADAYQALLIESMEADADIEDAGIFNVDFRYLTGSPDEAEVGMDGYVSLDDYIGRPGWYGQGVIIGNGYIGCSQSTLYEETGIITPGIDLSHNDGEFRVRIEVEAEEEDMFVVMDGAEMYAVEAIDRGERTVVDVTLKGGLTEDRLMLFTYYGSAFKLYSINVMQTLEKGDIVINQLSEDITDDSSATLPLYSPQDGYKLGIGVRSIREYGEKTLVSNMTKWLDIDLGQSEVEELNSGESLTIIGQSIVFSGIHTESDVMVASVDGKLLFDGKVKSGESMLLPHAGVWIVKINGKLHKLIVK